MTTNETAPLPSDVSRRVSRLLGCSIINLRVHWLALLPLGAASAWRAVSLARSWLSPRSPASRGICLCRRRQAVAGCSWLLTRNRNSEEDLLKEEHSCSSQSQAR